jgi:hypothetical protein
MTIITMTVRMMADVNKYYGAKLNGTQHKTPFLMTVSIMPPKMTTFVRMPHGILLTSLSNKHFDTYHNDSQHYG